MEKIILATKGNISAADKQALRRVGVCIAEVKDINAVKIIAGTDYFNLDDVSLSALKAVLDSTYDTTRVRFATELLKKILAAKAPNTSEPPK